jgi:LPXTG-motif cell wall-anchored protein
VKFKSSLHRTAAVLAGAVIGLAGVVAIAGPASAHTASVKGSTQCVNGQNVVTWTLNNDWKDDSGAKVENLSLPKGGDAVEITSNGSAGPKLQDGFVLLPASRHSSSTVSFTQTVDLAPSATITFDAVWKDYKSTNNTATVQLKQDCTPPVQKCLTADDLKHSHDAVFNHTFTYDEQGGATAIINLNDVKLCDDVQIPVTEVSYYAPKPQFSTPQYLFDTSTGVLTNTERTLKLWVDVPKCYTQVDTFFGGPDKIIPTITDNSQLYGADKLGSPRTKGHLYSKGPQAWYNGGSKACVTPASTSVPSCDGTQVINLSNSGKYEETFTVKYGDQVKTVAVGAGKGESIDVPAGAGTVTVHAEGMDDQTYNWTAPADCALPTATITNTCKDVTVTVTNPKDVTPATATVSYGKETKTLTVAAGASETATFAAGTDTFATIKLSGIDKEIKAALKKLTCTTPVGNNSGGGSLPITGSAGTSIAAGAVILLLAGGVFFFIARRRKVRFTA